MPQLFEYHLKISKINDPNPSQDNLLPIGFTTIGRVPENQIVLKGSGISKKHAHIHCSEDGCEITDLQSTNGTRINGANIPPMAPVALKHGDRVSISDFELLFELYRIQPAQSLLPPQASLPIHSIPTADKSEPEAKSPIIPPPPPTPPSPPLPPSQSSNHFDPSKPPPGLSFESTRLLRYLPDIYQSGEADFLSHFLAIFEAILFPIEWQIDNFDLFLDPKTASTDFLPWLARWFNIVFDPSWTEEQRRRLLKDAHQIYSRTGTVWAMRHLLEIYTGETPDIVDRGPNQKPHSFTVQFPFKEGRYPRAILEQLINTNKPAHTTYSLVFRK